MTLAVIFGSLLAVALWEFCLPRRRRSFRRCGGGSAISASGFSVWSSPRSSLRRRTRFRPQLETALGIAFPSWPIRDALVSFVVGFLLLDLMQYGLHRCQHAVPFLWRFHALHHSDPDVDVTTSVRHHPIEYLLASAVLLAGSAGARHPCDRRAEPRAGRFRRRRRHARQHQPAGMAGALVAAGGDHARLAPRPPLDRIRSRRTANYGAVFRSGIGCSEPTLGSAARNATASCLAYASCRGAIASSHPR